MTAVHRLQALWLDRTPREQLMLGMMFGLIGAVVIWYGVVQPSYLLAESTALNVQQAKMRLWHLNQEIAAANAVASKRTDNLRAGLDQAARQANINPRISTGDDGQITIELDRSPSDRALLYLVELERAGVVLGGLRITQYDDSYLRLTVTVSAE